MESQFQIIEDDEKASSYIENDKTENHEAFVMGLPEWDLEPPYDIIKRGNE